MTGETDFSGSDELRKPFATESEPETGNIGE